MITTDTKLAADITQVTEFLAEIIKEQAGSDCYRRVMKLHELSHAVRDHHDPADIRRKRAVIDRMSVAQAYAVTHACSLYFQLVNLCEERARVRAVTERPNLRQSLAALFRELKAEHVPASKIRKVVAELSLEPVLTAHPTEGKRRTSMTHLLRLNEQFADPLLSLEALWQTEEVRVHRVSPLNEVDNANFLFERVIFDAVADYYLEFERQLAHYYPEVRLERAPLTFASWIGGDRDGHPFVTPEVSLEAMERMRSTVMALYDRECDLLIEEISHADAEVPVLPADACATPDAFHPAESYRREIEGMRQRLHDRAYANPGEWIAELERMRTRLLAQKAVRAANGRLSRLIHQVRVFGFHLAELDFRDHSGKLTDAPGELDSELATIGELQRRHGADAAHRFILSMTHNAQQIVQVMRHAYSQDVKGIDIVPLFETIGDLQHSLAVVQELWADADYRAHLAQRGDLQEIMLGYSDSNKDGGYLAANWYLYRTQRQLSEAADSHGIRIRFFHGKGGTIDRGGGFSYRSLLAQPHASHGGSLRLTEQGEVIFVKYGHPVIARRNLEQLTAAVMHNACLDEETRQVRPEWEALMDRLAQSSYQHYRNLVESPGFIDYFMGATPIDLIEHTRIGSRPSRRSKSGSISELRAIPWVLAWTQSRHLLPAWYGIGSAFAELDEADQNLAAELYRNWPFFRVLIDNAELSLAKVDLYIAKRYASLLADTELRNRMFRRIDEEYQRSVAHVLKITGDSTLLESQPRLAESIRLRNPYVDPLHYLQIHFLKQWRETPAAKRSEEERRLLALTVNGIAFGMKSTG